MFIILTPTVAINLSFLLRQSVKLKQFSHPLKHRATRIPYFLGGDGERRHRARETSIQEDCHPKGWNLGVSSPH